MGMITSRNNRILIQGITGKQGTVICRDMIDYGTSVVAGVTPGKGGTRIYDIPVYDSVDSALKHHPDIDISLITVPPRFAREAAFEVLGKGNIKVVNLLTEGIPVRDASEIVATAREKNITLIGPSSVGLICPKDRVKIGAIGGKDPGVFYDGEIAIFSKSGGMCLSLATQLFNRYGYGISTVIGMGGDRIIGSNFVDLLKLALQDKDTEIIIMNGEVGGSYEEAAADYIRRTKYPKPIICLISGVGAEHFFPRGSRMGHAGAVIGEGSTGTYENKMKKLREAGVKVAKSSDELVQLVGKLLKKKDENHLEEKDLEKPELVAIAKPKLESMKVQVREITLKSVTTKLQEGKPYLLGYSFSDLIIHAALEEILFMVLKKRRPKVKEQKLLKRMFTFHLKNLPVSARALQTAIQSVESGNALNAAVAAGLLAQDEVSVESIHEDLKEILTPREAESLILELWVIQIVGNILTGEYVPKARMPLEFHFYRAIAGRNPTLHEADVFRGIFAACVDHTPAVPSSLAAITTYSGGVSLKTALAAGITAMGDTHAGAGEGAATAFQVDAEKAPSKDSVENQARWLIDFYTGKFGGLKRRIPGFGHRYYSLYGADPRAKEVMKLAVCNGFKGHYIKLAQEVERILQGEKAPGLCMNVDGAIGAIISEMGIAPKAGKAMFIIPRTAGILGQLIEQKEGSFFRLDNQSITYVGPEPPVAWEW